MSVFDLIGADGVRRPFTGDIEDLDRPAKDRLRINQAEATRLGLGEIPTDLEDRRWWRHYYPVRPEDGELDYDLLTHEEEREQRLENSRRNRLLYEHARYIVPERATRPRHGPPIMPRWADDPVSLKPVTPATYSFRLRRGFRTLMDRGHGREEVWIVGLFHLTRSDGSATFVVEHAGEAWATTRADARPWPAELNTMFDRSPDPWLPVDARPLPAVPTDPATPLDPPTSIPFPARIATENIIRGASWRDGAPTTPYRPHPPEDHS
ncbi:hypothetical protein [Actinomyces sp. oral taxon 448]|uniref:hypothetical protein n=1 Tax=Actinomyces sp. oral taxon 448 TaxID=712124 RepID=UPI0002188C8D|nr:hypothetical protein [Actinomyces sp. oral taxon 448]EGQ74051.1 hypothetical protein HMPREF9062_1283 [Actinomyces sp. oral taxon 448 str. F0400]